MLNLAAPRVLAAARPPLKGSCLQRELILTTARFQGMRWAMLAAILGLLFLFSVPAREARACAVIIPSDPHERLAAQLRVGELVVLGQVSAERPAEPWERRSGYVSTIEPVVVLRGEAPENIRLTALGAGLGPDCSGGPRLPVGERVFLAVPSHPQIQATIIIGIYPLDRSHFGEEYRFPTPEALVQEAAGLVGASPDLTEAAIRFAVGEIAPTPSATPPLLSTAGPIVQAASPESATGAQRADNGTAFRWLPWLMVSAAVLALGTLVGSALFGRSATHQ